MTMWFRRLVADYLMKKAASVQAGVEKNQQERARLRAWLLRVFRL
jgi:hypothetical protein